MKVALLFSSKTGMEATLSHRPDERRDEEDEPPSPIDLLAECDSDETIAAVGRVLQERHQVAFIESDEKAYARLAGMNSLLEVPDRIVAGIPREIFEYRYKRVLTLEDEKVASLHLAKVGAKLTRLSAAQAGYIGVAPAGPFKSDHYRY